MTGMNRGKGNNVIIFSLYIIFKKMCESILRQKRGRKNQRKVKCACLNRYRRNRQEGNEKPERKERLKYQEAKFYV